MISEIRIFNKIKNNGNYLLFILLIAFLSFTLYKVFYFPVYIDEATTYNDYVSKGVWGVLSSYKEPNNHVLYSLFLVFFTKLPVDSLIAMRLLNVVLAVSSILLMYQYLREKYAVEIVFISLFFFAFSYYFLFYAIFARGYMLLILCTISIFIVLDEIRYRSKQTKQFIYFCLISWVGFCTIPIFLYIYLSFVLIIGIRFFTKVYSVSLLVPFILSSFLTIVGVFLFYLPILLHDGMDAIINNKWTVILSYQDVANYLSAAWLGFYDKIFGIRSCWIMALLILFGIYYFIKKKESRVFLIQHFSLLFLPFVFIFLHKVIPGSRTWSYLIVPFTLIIAFYLQELLLIKQISYYKKFFPILCFGLLFFLVTIFNKSHSHAGLKNDIYFGKVAQFLVKKQASKIFFINGDSSYESVIYTFYKKTTVNNVKEIKLENDKFLYVGDLNVLKGLRKYEILYFDKNIHLCVYRILY